jgi:hypothetical protein
VKPLRGDSQPYFVAQKGTAAAVGDLELPHRVDSPARVYHEAEGGHRVFMLDEDAMSVMLWEHILSRKITPLPSTCLSLSTIVI